MLLNVLCEYVPLPQPTGPVELEKCGSVQWTEVRFITRPKPRTMRAKRKALMTQQIEGARVLAVESRSGGLFRVGMSFLKLKLAQ
jgi:hypothetical protein